MSLIEEQFVEKTEKKEKYRVLVNYWNNIKMQEPKILSCISQVFPHYTMHDVSHSHAILDSIERFLGPNIIIKLSVTDLWLLLCSTYSHDIGMYIMGDEIQKCFDSEEFQQFVLKQKKDASSPLNKYAVFYDIDDNKKLRYKNCNLSLESYNSARFLLAEYFRNKHAERSKTFIESDNSVNQMYSEIKRLISITAEICRLHSADFSEVMKFYDLENGIGDYCHPRFVACMLRIGDLLDFDSSRVSWFLLKHLSSSIPENSLTHNEKNFNVVHALVTPEKVDVFAECSDCNVAFEMDKWFSWIRDEMSNQRNSWNEISPVPEAKGYPMLGKLETKLIGGYDTIDNNFKPKFEIDTDKATEILQGSGLYDSKSQCIREILQNAIDATYLRIYLENRNDFEKLPLEKGVKKFISICKSEKYQIEFKCERKENSWHIEIQDNGIGIRKEDLKYLLKVGSGINNKKKFEMIEEMPDYARPSGIFGIGFQSIFLITDKVSIETRSAKDNEVINLEIGTPLKGGFAILKTKKDQFARIGTKVSFEVKDEQIKDEEYIDYNTKYNYENVMNKDFDFIEDEIHDVEFANIINEVKRVGKYSYVNIIYRGKAVEKIDRKYDKVYYDETTNMIMEIALTSKHNGWDFNILYRNEVIKDANESLEMKFLGWRVNILSKSSKEILLVNRNDIKSERCSSITHAIRRLGIRWIEDNWNILDDKERIRCAAFIEYFGDNKQKKDMKQYWQKLSILEVPIEKILSYKIVVIAVGKSEAKIVKEKNKIIIYEDYLHDDFFDFLFYIIKKYYTYGLIFKCYRDENGKIKRLFEFHKDHDDRMDLESLLRALSNGSRYIIPCNGYEKLRLKDDDSITAMGEQIHFFEKVIYSKMVCPCIKRNRMIEWNCSDKLYQWVYDNRFDEKVTLDEIKDEYENMKKKLKSVVEEINLETKNLLKQNTSLKVKNQLENDKSKKSVKSKTASKSKVGVKGSSKS